MGITADASLMKNMLKQFDTDEFDVTELLATATPEQYNTAATVIKSLNQFK